MSTPPQTPLERYKLLEPLGEGGQGRTFHAVDSVSGKAVAVKVIQLRGSEGWKPFDLFERECKVLRSLDHPGIPRYLDTFSLEQEGRFFLVMELMEGTSLKEMQKSGQPLGEPQLWSLLHQALDILGYLHGLHPPVIHRDLKPANLILRHDGRLALVDFGGVRLALRQEGGSTMVGTYGYLAPEQLHGEATPATDIFSLGVTIASLAAGREADKLPRLGLKLDLEGALSPSPLLAVLQRMIEPDPTARLSCVAMVRESILAAGRAAEERGDSQLLEEEAPDKSGDSPLSLLVRIIGSLGYVGFVLLESVLLPLIFGMLSASWSNRPRRLAKLQQRERTIRAAVVSGRKTMKALAMGREPRALRPGPRLPPSPPTPSLPPHGAWRRKKPARGGRRHRGGGQR